MRRGCLISLVVLLGLCVLCTGGAYFVGLPQLRDAVGEGFEDAMSTEVAQRLAPNPRTTPAPGTYTITEASLRESLQAEAEEGSVEDVIIRITPAEIEFGFTTGEQDVSYSGGVAAEDGKLVLTDFESNNDALEFIFPADRMAEAIEDAVNNYLEENNLRLADVTLAEGEMILDVRAAR